MTVYKFNSDVKRENSLEPAREKRKGKMSSAKFFLECGASEMKQNAEKRNDAEWNDASRLRVELGRERRVLIAAKRSEKRERPLWEQKKRKPK